MNDSNEEILSQKNQWIKWLVNVYYLKPSGATACTVNDILFTCNVCGMYNKDTIVLQPGKSICQKHFDWKDWKEEHEDGDSNTRPNKYISDQTIFDSNFRRYGDYFASLAVTEFYDSIKSREVGVKNTLENLSDKYLNFNLFDRTIRALFNSAILIPSHVIELIKLCDFDLETEFSLVYRASLHGFSAKDFHQRCDKYQKTLTLIKVKNDDNGYSIFGGYTEASWEQKGPIGHHKEDKNAFVFSLVNRENNPFKIKTSDSSKSIYVHKDVLVAFGAGELDPGSKYGHFDFDLIIFPYSNTKSLSHTRLFNSTTYTNPADIIDIRYVLQGRQNGYKKSFLTSEIEVYSVTIK